MLLLASLKKGPKSALAYMDRQKNERPEKQWLRWKPLFQRVKNEISENAQQAEKSLKVWHDLTVAAKTEKGTA